MSVKIPDHLDSGGPSAMLDQREQPLVRTRTRKLVRVKVGGVIVNSERASAAQVKKAVADSGAILERLAQKIARPGTNLKAARNIPLYSADPNEPNLFLRKLNGQVDRGVLENGDFKVVN